MTLIAGRTSASRGDGLPLPASSRQFHGVLADEGVGGVVLPCRIDLPMIAPRTQRMTISEFDEWALSANEQFTYELHDGVAYGFATGTEEHSLISVRLTSWLLPLVAAPCRVHQGGVSVRRHPDRPSSVVPDVLVTCEPRDRGRIYVTSPNFVAEVISPSSVTNDMYRKPIIYDAIDSVMEYLVIDSRSMWVRLFRRTNDRRLLPDGDDLITADQSVSLTTVDLQFTLADLYKDVL